MTLIDDAVRLEEEARRAYTEAAARVRDTSARKILHLLAEQEAAHADALRHLAEPVGISGANLLAEAKSWIRGAVEGGALHISEDAGLLDILRRASEMERLTEAFYREHADADEGVEPRRAALFRELAEVERAHFVLVSSLVDYFDRPNEWVEAAEFGLRPEY